MQLKRVQSCILGFLLVMSFSACGGGGDTSTLAPTTLSATSAEGFWNGMNGTNRRTVTGVVLNDGVYWFLYSMEDNPEIIAGVIQGNSTSQNGSLTSSDATDFSVERGIPPTLNATITGNYIGEQSLDGTISYQNNTQEKFTTTYGNDYESTPDINAVVGTYTGPVAANETVSVTVSSSGNIIGRSITDPTITGCTFGGSFQPRTHGNVFDVSITFNGERGCSNGNGTVKGVGFFHAGKLYSAALNADRTNGVVFLGTKS